MFFFLFKPILRNDMKDRANSQGYVNLQHEREFTLLFDSSNPVIDSRAIKFATSNQNANIKIFRIAEIVFN